jgi:hypothetical protein
LSLHGHLLESPARPKLSFALCASAGTEPGGEVGVRQFVMTLHARCVVTTILAKEGDGDPRHFQERMPYGLFVPDVPDATAYTLDGSESV